MAKDDLKVIGIFVSIKDGQRIEYEWKDIPEEERQRLPQQFMDRCMLAVGYVPEKSKDT